jgi:hypothetical protein
VFPREVGAVFLFLEFLALIQAGLDNVILVCVNRGPGRIQLSGKLSHDGLNGAVKPIVFYQPLIAPGRGSG